MAVDPNVLLNEVSCLNCNSNASMAQLLELAFLQRIDASGGGGGGGTPGGPINAVQFQNPLGVFAGSAELTFNDTTNVLQLIGSQNILQVVSNVTALTIAGHALSGANAQSMISGAGTWNTTGNPVALRFAITDTASGATSKFLEFLGGAGGATSLFNVDKLGNATGTTFLAGNGAVGAPSLSFASQTDLGIYRVGALRLGFVTNGNLIFEVNNTIVELKAGVSLSFNGATALFSDDPTTIDQRNGVTAQSFKVYRTFTNSTNYERLSLGSAAGQMIVAAETAGTGTDNIDLMLTAAGTGLVNVTLGIIRHGVGFTVATLPAAGLAGRKAYVTDGLGAAWGVAIAGGGAQTVPVFDNGAAWIAG